MKRSIAYRFILILLCASMLFPGAVYADNDEKTSPEDWLNDEEKAYVAQMRTTFSECRNVMSQMKGLLAKPNVYYSGWGVEMSILAGLLAGAYEPFCALRPPESMERFASEHDRFCGFAYVCVSEAQNTGNQWMSVSARWNVFQPLPYIYLLNNVHDAITRVESAMGSAEHKLNKIIADIAEGREKIAEFIGELIGDCFIATAVYGAGDIETLNILREFRDECLLTSLPGEVLVSLYYKVSPPFARLISGNDRLKLLVKWSYLDPLVCLIERSKPLWGQ